MRRGFKSWCERTAAEYRQTLHVPIDMALDPGALAALLRVRVTTPEELPALSAASCRQLIEIDAASWSAVTVSQGSAHLVVLNSSHSPARRASSLAHELAHIILNHVSDQVQLSCEGLLFRTTFDKEQEQEADWLGGCLLVPREGLLRMCLRLRSHVALAEHFRVSEQLMAWRLRMTGVEKQVRRSFSTAPEAGADRLGRENP